MDRFPTPAACHLGWGAVSHVGEDARRLRARRALIVASHGLQGSPILRRVEEELEDEGIGYRSVANASHSPDAAAVRETLGSWREERADLLVSVGGGNAHDLAKAVGAASAGGVDVLDLEGSDTLRAPNPPHIAVNTTAGTGSELSRYAFITSHRRGRRMMISDSRLTPRVAINDPAIHAQMPARLTAASGMNVLTHAIGAHLSPSATPLASDLALDALEAVAQNLARAVENGDDEEARQAMAHAEQLAGLAYNGVGLGLADAMSLCITAVYDVPHGELSAALLPYVLAYTAPAASERLAQIADALLGADAPRGVAQKAHAACEAVAQLTRRVDLPTSLHALGIDDQVGYSCAQTILQNPFAGQTPRPPDLAAVNAILEEAVLGTTPADAARALGAM